jgi:uncharacterized protein YidB (DUF937 family)
MFAMSILDRLINHAVPELNLQPGQGMQLIHAIIHLVQSHPGGIAGLMQDFEKSGLVHVSKSWVGTGPNMPISVEDMQRVISQQQMDEVARQTLMTNEQVRQSVARVLPQLVDILTLQGQLPKDRAEAVKALEALKNKLLDQKTS